MPLQQDFLSYAVGSSANVLTQAQYAALTTLLQNGLTSGIVPSNELNKILRQPSIMASVIGQLIVAKSGQPAIDDGTTATLLANLETAILVISQSGTGNYALDVGGANAIVVNMAPVLFASPAGTVVRAKIAATNTGATSIEVNGLTAVSVVTAEGNALVGGELLAGAIAEFVSDGTAFRFRATQGRLLGFQVLSIPGAVTYNPTPGTRHQHVRQVGGGGGSGGNPPTTVSQQAYSGAAGAGAYGEGWFSITSPLACTVGAPGAGGTTSVLTGQNGGTTSFGASMSTSGGFGTAAGVPNAGISNVGGGAGGNVVTGANIFSSFGAGGEETLSSAMNFVGAVLGGASLLGAPATYPTATPQAGAGGNSKYNGAGTASNQPGFSGGPGLIIIAEYA